MAQFEASNCAMQFYAQLGQYYGSTCALQDAQEFLSHISHTNTDAPNSFTFLYQKDLYGSYAEQDALKSLSNIAGPMHPILLLLFGIQ